jgi:putative acetyltransferase
VPGRPAVRALLAADAAAVDGVVERAFGRRAEADLVRALRQAEASLLERVAVDAGGAVVGYVALSRVTPERLAAGVVASGLGPLAVEPACQRAGVGAALAEAGIEACAARGDGLLFVLGHPEYYPRFGFRSARELGFRYRSPDFDRAFFVRELVPGAARGGGGLVRYAPAFEAT